MKLSLFSVSYAGLWGQHQLELPDFIAKSASLGFKAVMLAGKRPHLSPLDADARQLAGVRRVLEENAVMCAVIGGYTDLSPANAAEVPYLEMQIAYVESLARIAREYGDGHRPHLYRLRVRSAEPACGLDGRRPHGPGNV